MKNRRATLVRAIRALLLLDGAIFAAGALLNFGLRIPIGVTELAFPTPIAAAGIWELAIGATLVAAGVTMHPGLGWLAVGLSIAGIAFGLASPGVEGPARDLHLLLVPLAVVVTVLLAARSLADRKAGGPGMARRHEERLPAAADSRLDGLILALLLVAAIAFAGASLIHAGAVLAVGPLAVADSFPGAVVPEAILAAVLGIAGLAVARRWEGRASIALAATVFALALTLFGLTITIASRRTPDVAYHLAILAILVGTLACLVWPSARLRLRRS